MVGLLERSPCRIDLGKILNIIIFGVGAHVTWRRQARFKVLRDQDCWIPRPGLRRRPKFGALVSSRHPPRH